MSGQPRYVSFRVFVLVTGALGSVIMLLLGAAMSQAGIAARVGILETAPHPVGSVEYRADHDKINRMEVVLDHNVNAIDELVEAMKAHEDLVVAALAAIVAAREPDS